MLDYFIGTNGLDSGQKLIVLLLGLGAAVGVIATLVGAMVLIGGSGGGDDQH